MNPVAQHVMENKMSGNLLHVLVWVWRETRDLLFKVDYLILINIYVLIGNVTVSRFRPE